MCSFSLMKLLTLWAFKKKKYIYIYLDGRLADHSDFVWAFHFQSQGKALWGRGWMMMMMMMIVKIW